MEGVVLWLIIIAVVVGIGVLRAHLRARREQQDQREIEEHRRQRKEAEEAAVATAAWLEIKEAFPFLPTPTIEEPTAEKIYERVGLLLGTWPSLGTLADGGLPAPALPVAERRRHLYVVGKTGSGKSTFLEHLVTEDLNEGRGVGVIGPEGEFFRDRLLPLVPERREDEVIYFAPGNPKNPLTFNPLAIHPGEDAVRAAEDLFTIFKRALSEEEIGARMQPIIQNAFAALVGRPGMTLWEVKRLLEDPAFRREIAETTVDQYVRAFWLETYPRYPKGADLPIVNRLDQFLRPPALRRTLCHPESSFSIREALAKGQILFLDLFGLSEENRLLLGQMLLSKFQLELMRRELTGTGAEPFHLYADEFQSFAGVAEGTWRELLSRGRKYGLCLTLAHQYPAQLPTGLQEEILGNVNSLVSFALGAKDADVVRRELLQRVTRGAEERIEPLAAAALIELPTGGAYAKFAGGRAVKLTTPAPLRIRNPERAEEVIAASWERYGASPIPPPASPGQAGSGPPAQRAPKAGRPEEFLE